MERQVGAEPRGAAARPDPWELPDVSGLSIGVLGGTGEQGRGLATRWAAAGQPVIIGSRDAERARQAADEVRAAVTAAVSSHAQPPPIYLRGVSNDECAKVADVVVVAVPWASHREVVANAAEDLRGKILIDCVNPLGFDKQGAFALQVPEGSAAQQAAALALDATVVAAFHHVSAKLLLDLQTPTVRADVMVLGEDRIATDTVAALVGLIPGMRGIYAGRLRNAHQVEALTANLISMNRRYRAHAGIAITDV